MRTPEDAARRRKELAKIHVLATQLCLDDPTYRTMLQAVAGVDSSALLDAAGRRKVLDHLAGKMPKGTSYPGRPHNIASGEAPAELRKIEALLAEAGRPWSYADAMAKRIAGVERCAFLDPIGAHKVLAALIYDAKRRADREAP